MSKKTREATFLRDVRDEVEAARRRFAGNDGTFAAAAVELGEVGAALQGGSSNLIYVECVQLAAAALRIALEGDDSLQDIRLILSGKPPFLGRE